MRTVGKPGTCWDRRKGPLRTLRNRSKSVEIGNQATDANEFDRLGFRGNYGFIEARVGNFSTGLQALKDAVLELRKLPTSGDPYVIGHRNGRIAVFESSFAAFSAIVGNLEDAKFALRKGKMAMSNLQDVLDVAENNDVIVGSETVAGFIAARTMSLSAAADIERFNGDLKQAESQIANAIEVSSARPGNLTGFSIEQLDGLGIFAKGIQIEILRAQGRIVESETRARDLVKHAIDVHGRYSGRTFYALRALVSVLIDQSRFADAVTLVAEVNQLMTEAQTDMSSLLSIALRLQGAQATTGQRRWSAAAEEFLRLASEISQDDGTLSGLLIQDPARGLALFRGGKPQDAVAAATAHAVKMRNIYGPRHYRVAEAEAFQLAVELNGGSAGGLKSLKQSIVQLFEQRKQRGPLTPIDAMRLEVIVESLAVAADTQDRDVDLAFQLAEEIRGGELASTIASSAIRNFAGTPALAELIRRKQDLQQQSDAVFATLNQALGLPSALRNSGEETRLRDQAAKFLDALTVIDAEIEAQYPNYDDLIHPQPPTIADVQKQLGEDEVALIVFDGEDRSILWAIPGQGEPLARIVNMGRLDLKARVDGLRQSLDLSGVRRIGDIPAFDLSAAYDLYRKVLEPTEAAWKDKSNLFVIAHGALGYLPFALLPMEDAGKPEDKGLLFSGYRDAKWLGKNYTITSLPSTGSLQILRSQVRKRTPGPIKFLGFGDPFFNQNHVSGAEKSNSDSNKVKDRGGAVTARSAINFRSAPVSRSADSATIANLPRLPETVDELRSIAASLKADPAVDVVVGLAANESQIKSTNMRDIDILAFATHGLAVGDLDGLNQPALAFTPSSLLGAAAGDDGLLTMGEILGLQLNADWIILSACNTGAGDGIGAKAVSGLGRAFFYAGTRGLLVTNWPVETYSAKLLTTGLFERYAADTKAGNAHALRETIVSMIESDVHTDEGSKVALFSYAHPVFWAPFTFVGVSNAGPQLTQ